MQRIFTCKDQEWWEGTQGTKNDQRIKQEGVEMMNGTELTEKSENNKKISERINATWIIIADIKLVQSWVRNKLEVWSNVE